MKGSDLEGTRQNTGPNAGGRLSETYTKEPTRKGGHSTQTSQWSFLK